MSKQQLSRDVLSAALAGLDGWSLVEGEQKMIAKSYRFANFVNAFGWMTQVALICEKMDHHPEWSNVYRNVDVKLSTHDAKGLTQLDIDLAAA
ncbi:MAG: 4a-hydroxytetrahydrobiopterin dehydratase, partial [Pseudomonadota bacterium]